MGERTYRCNNDRIYTPFRSPIAMRGDARSQAAPDHPWTARRDRPLRASKSGCERVNSSSPRRSRPRSRAARMTCWRRRGRCAAWLMPSMSPTARARALTCRRRLPPLFSRARDTSRCSSSPAATATGSRSRRSSWARPPPGWHAEKLAAKVSAGAQFAQTQFCMDKEIVRRYAARLKEHETLRDFFLLIGVAPLRSAKSARWMKQHLFGSIIPDGLVERLERAADPATEGDRICAELIEALAAIPGVAGVHVMAPANEAALPRVVREARQRLALEQRP